MLKKLNAWMETKRKKLEEKQQLHKAQSYYKLVKAGATFRIYNQEDLKNEQNKMNRHERRRMLKELEEKGVLSPELVGYYQQKIDYVLQNIYMRLNPPKPVNNKNVKVQTEKPSDAK